MKDKRIITFEPELCSGCMYCMTACSTCNTGITSLSRSRIRIIRHEGFAISNMDEQDDLLFAPIYCRQCEDAPCEYICPVGAISPDPDTGAYLIDHNKCIGCRMCLTICPFGAISFDSTKKQTFKCELCGGDPWCVKMCAGKALKFVPAKEANIKSVNRAATREMTDQLAGKRS